MLALSLALACGPVLAIMFDPGAPVSYAHRYYGAKAGRAAESWQAMLNRASSLDEAEKLHLVNDFWNHTLARGASISIWGQVDYWATPLQSLSKGAGDGEGYVIGKYFSLLYLGVAPEKLRFVHTRASIDGQSIAHIVLGYYPQPQAEPLVLDSLVDGIQPAHHRSDLTPVFSFNAQQVSISDGERFSAEGIGRWRDLLSRMRTEGFRP